MLQNPLILAEESKIMRAFQQHLKTRTVADLGEGPHPPLILGKQRRNH